MRHFIDSVITLTLIFVMLVVAPINIATGAREIRTERMVLREVNQFIDRVGDSKEIRQVDLDNFYLGVNSHGGEYDIKVTREVRAVYYNKTNDVIQEIYFNNQNMDIIKPEDSIVLNVGDIIKVKIKAIQMGRGQRMFWNVSRLDKGQLDLEIKQIVR